jgi:hypothetical protein
LGPNKEIRSLVERAIDFLARTETNKLQANKSLLEKQESRFVYLKLFGAARPSIPVDTGT